jgi:GT2 family glycosyltransferase
LAPVPREFASVVVVCCNSGAYLPRCLHALAAQSFRDFEVLIVDNASTDGSTSDLPSRHPDLRIRLERLSANVGFAAACNVGARLARGGWLVLLNPDAFPHPGWLRELLSAAESHPNSFFASRQIQANRPQLLDGEGDIYYTSGLALRANYNVPHFGAAPPREVFSACAAAAMYPRAEYLSAGGFDEDYFAYHEDVDLGFRLRLRGLRCFLVQAAAVQHVGGASSGRRSSFAVYHGHRNMVWTYAKNMPAPWVWLYLPLHVVANLVSIIYFIFVGHGLSILRAKVDALKGLRRALTKRRLIQADIQVPAGEAIRQMNTNIFGPLEGWISRQWPMMDS